MKGTPITQEKITEIMHLYGKGKTGRRIAEEVGIPHSSVHRIISSNSLHITSKAASGKSAKKTASKGAKPVVKVSTRHTFTPFAPPPGAPICNATSMGEPYRCPELSYRQPARA